MDPVVVACCIVAAIVGATTYRRLTSRRRQGAENARNVEAERILALLSARQPGVWDVDDMRDRVHATARDLWTLATRTDLERLQTWVHSDLLAETLRTWPARAFRREMRASFPHPPAFVQVVEGGPGEDRVIARVEAALEGDWLDIDGRRVRHERRPMTVSYHHWTHIDGQGWRLDHITSVPPVGEPPPSSVSCRIMPQGASEETGSNA